MNIIQYIRIIRRWLLVITVSTFVITSLVFIVAALQTPEYRAQTTIIVGGYIESPNPELQDIRTGLDLAQTYDYLINSREVLQAVLDELQPEFDLEELRDLLDTNVVSGTSLLQIRITHTDAIESRNIANEIALQLINQSPNNLTLPQQEQVNLLNDQIATLSDELADYREQSETIELELANLILSDLERTTLTEQRNFLLEQINQASANIAQFSTTVANLQQRSNSVEIVEYADIPSEPVGLSLWLITAITSATSLFFCIGSVFLYEYLTDKIENTESATQYLQLPMLGVITRFGNQKDAYSQRLISHLPAMSKTKQEYSTLRTNLLYSAQQNFVYIISSASPQEGKSVTAMNLAISSALAGQRVLLIDADLRRPRLHQGFEIENNKGLTTLLQNAPADSASRSETFLSNVIHKTDIEGLSILPSGFMPHNPAELLGFVTLKQWLSYIKEQNLYDLILFDTPPVLAVPDAAILAANIQASVLLVLQANSTRRIEALQAKQRFEQINIAIEGLILNQVTRLDDSYYGYRYQDYYTPFTLPAELEKPE